MKFRKYFVGAIFVLAAATQLRAAEREYEAVPVTVERTRDSEGIQDLQLKADVYNVWYEKSYEKRTYQYYDCDTEVGDGTDGNWYGFWNARKEEKANALSQAVKGIGYNSAKKIVDSHEYFLKKPRSWNAFRAEIQNIANDRSLALDDLYYNVVIVYGKDNAQNLGYASAQNCQWKEVTEMVPVVNKKRDFLKSVKTTINLLFEGGLLLSNEKETFKIQYDGLEVKVFPTRVMNEYQVRSRDDRDFTLKAVRRLAVKPDLSKITASIIKEDGTVKLRLDDHLIEELQKLFPETSLQVTYKVVRSAMIDNNEAEGVIQMKGTSATVDLKTHPVWEKMMFSSRRKSFTAGKSYYVTLQIQRLNSQTFSSEKSEAGKTSEIVY